MKRVRWGVAFWVMVVAGSSLFGQQAPRVSSSREPVGLAERQQKLEQVLLDKSGYAAAIVRRWENDAKAVGRWDPNFAEDLTRALMKLHPENLLAAGEATSYAGMMEVLATGREHGVSSSDSKEPTLIQALGDTSDDLVYTPVNPCRIIDTRLATAGALNGMRTFDVDGSNFSAQGGSNASCGIPFGVAHAVAMTITVTQGAGVGFVNAWGLGTQPLSSVLDFAPGETLANTSIIPVAPGGGDDFTIYSSVTSQIIVDVVGYFAAPVATALDCITINSASTAVAVNVWTSIDALCPAGRIATGGGYDAPTEGTLGYPGIWTTTVPGSVYGFNGWRTWVDNQTSGTRSLLTYVRCCRVPGR